MSSRRSRSTNSGRNPDLDDPREAEWVSRAAAGDETAFRCLVELHQDRVYGIALRMMQNDDLASEVAQDAFIKVFRGLGKFQSRSRFATWLYRIVVNACYDRLGRRDEAADVNVDDLVAKGREPAAGHSWTSGAGIEADQAAAAFEEALLELGETYRLAFVLRQVEERSYDEIAAILGITENNAKVRVHRAREAVVKYLKMRGVL